MDLTDIDRLAHYLLKQVDCFIDAGDYAEFSVSEVVAALELMKMEYFARCMKESGFHQWPGGINLVEAARLRGETPPDTDIIDADLEDTQEIDLEDLDDEEDDTDE